MIDIIIPAFNSHDTIVDTLMSISIQTYRDRIKVYICNDCSDNDYSDQIDMFKDIINIQELKLKENSGPGVARQFGIDHSDSEYIVFIDSDDMFYTPISIKSLYDTITYNNLDIVVSNFKEEVSDGYFDHINDAGWLHGKIYRRKFLEDNNIRFNKSRNNEDNFFNKSIFIRNPRMCYIDDMTYLWKNNEKSITRKNNHEYEYLGYFELIDNLIEVLENAIKDGVDRDNICEYSYSFLLSVYFFYLEFYNKENSDVIIKKSKRLKELYDEYRFKSKEMEDNIYFNNISHYFYNDKVNVLKPIITLEEFLKLYDNF